MSHASRRPAGPACPSRAPLRGGRWTRRLVFCALLACLPAALPAADTSIRVGDAQVSAGGAGTFPLSFPVTRTGDAFDGVRLQVETVVGGTNPAIPGDDYVPLPPGTEAVLAPGQAGTTVNVAVIGQAAAGPDKTLLLRLTGARAFHPLPWLLPAGMHYPVRSDLPNTVAAADLNGDGQADIVTGNDLSLNVSVLPSDGEGGFSDALVLPLAGQASMEGFAPRVVAVALGDVTGDGHRDVVAIGGLYVPTEGGKALPATIQIFPGDGAGGVAQSPLTLPLPSTAHLPTPFPGRIAVADVNNDGRLDVVATTGDGAGNSSVSVLLGDGRGGFAPEAVFALDGAGLRALAVADVSGDGFPDIVAGGFPHVQVLLGDGGGQFATPVQFSTGDGVALVPALALVDATGDGHLDIIAANSHSPNPPSPPYTHGSISLLVGDGSGGFASAVSLASSPAPLTSLAVGQLTGDSHADIVFTRSDDRGFFSDYVGLLAGDGAGNFAAPVQIGPTGAAPSAVTVADVTGDGQPDAIVTNATGGTVSILPGNGDGTVGFAGHFAVGNRPHSAVAIDVNGDGLPDLATANVLGHNVSVLINDGAGGFADAMNIPVGFSPRAIVAADIDANGHIDLIVANGGSGDVSVLLGNGSGFAAAVNIGLGGGFNFPVAVATGDVNGDGHLDILTGNSVAGPGQFEDSVSLLLGDGDGGFAAPVTIELEPHLSLQSIALADVTGDGDLDIVTANSIPGTLSILVGDGAGGFSPGSTLPAGISPVAVLVDDVTGDGHPDLVALIHAEHSVAVLAGDGSGGFGAAALFPIHPENVCGDSVNGLCPWPWGMVLADVTGDGHLDIVTANTDNDSVSVLANDGNGGFSIARYFHTGANPRSVAVADIDGDGNLDVVSANSRGSTVSVLLNDLIDVELLVAEAIGTIIAPGSADLAVTASANPASVGVGEAMTFRVALQNHGPEAAGFPGVGLALDAELEDLGVGASAGWSCDAPDVGGGATSIACTADALAAGDGADFVATATAPGSADGDAITMIAVATSTTPDADFANNSDSASVSVGAMADLAVTISGPPVFVRGTVATYAIELDNLGPAPAPQTSVSLALGVPAAHASVATPAGWACVVQAASLYRAICSPENGTFAIGEPVLFAVSVATAGRLFPPRFAVQAAVDSAAMDPDASDNTASLTVRLGRP